jgi:hypothetical protein
MHVLEKMIKELVPARDVDSTIRRAIALHDRATRAREGRGQTLDVEPAPSLPLIVDAAAKVIWGDDRSVFLRDTNNELLTGELTPKELSWDETVPDSMVKRYPVNKVFEGSS